jgi:hypothetical protein
MWTIAARGATDRQRKVCSVQISHTHFRVEFPRSLKPTHCGCAAAPRLERANSAFVGAEQFGIIRRDGAQRVYV